MICSAFTLFGCVRFVCVMAQRCRGFNKEVHERADQTCFSILEFGDPAIWMDRFVELNRKLEYKVQGIGGMKFMYAHTYYTEDEFWISAMGTRTMTCGRNIMRSIYRTCTTM